MTASVTSTHLLPSGADWEARENSCSTQGCSSGTVLIKELAGKRPGTRERKELSLMPPCPDSINNTRKRISGYLGIQKALYSDSTDSGVSGTPEFVTSAFRGKHCSQPIAS